MADDTRGMRQEPGYGMVTDYATGEPVRPATREEWLRTRGPRPRGLGDATGSWDDGDGRVVYVNCGEGMISGHAGRPAGATGVHWTARALIFCFAFMDRSEHGCEPPPEPGEFVFDPALTGKHDDCACDWHTWRRRRGVEQSAARQLN